MARIRMCFNYFSIALRSGLYLEAIGFGIIVMSRIAFSSSIFEALPINIRDIANVAQSVRTAEKKSGQRRLLNQSRGHFADHMMPALAPCLGRRRIEKNS